MFDENKWGVRILIACDAIGGLNNRLRCLVSAMRVDNNIKLIWTVKENDVHLWCSFEDLFINNFEVFNNKMGCYSKYPNLVTYSDYKFIKLPEDDMDINHLDKEIDKLFKSFEKQLDENNFGLYIDPQPLYPNDHVSVE